jgi:glycosyltransferase involved in cell wall biosynthesis
MNPLISIIIPVYNAEKMISGTIDSILKQSFKDFEVIVVDGLSKDNTRGIVLELAATDTRIRIISEKDTGIYDAMNKGIMHSQGNWLYFLGADDELYDKNVLSNIAEQLHSTRAKVVYGDVILRGDSPWAKHGDVYDGPFDVEKLFEKNICHQAIFYHKTIFDAVGVFNTDYDICADWDLNHRCFATVKTEYTNHIIARFSGGGKSTLKRSDKFAMGDCLINLKRYYKISYLNRLFRYYVSTFFFQSKVQLTHRRFGLAFKFFIASFWHSQQKATLAKAYLKAFLNFFIKPQTGKIST